MLNYLFLFQLPKEISFLVDTPKILSLQNRLGEGQIDAGTHEKLQFLRLSDNFKNWPRKKG